MSDKSPSALPADASPSIPSPTPPKSPAGSSAPKKTKASKAAHFVLQGKGGVGKTLVSSLLAQYFATTGVEVRCLDTDPVNNSLAAIPALHATVIPLYKPGTSQSDHRGLDKMLSDMIASPATYVVDNGASSFKPMTQHLLDDEGIDILLDTGCTVALHLVIATGPELDMTLSGVATILDAVQGSDLKAVLWLNERQGSFEEAAGVGFEDSEFYKEYRTHIAGVITIPVYPPATKSVFDAMLQKKMTFDEAEAHSEFYVVEQSRLKKLKVNLFSSISTGLEGV